MLLSKYITLHIRSVQPPTCFLYSTKSFRRHLHHSTSRSYCTGLAEIVLYGRVHSVLHPNCMLQNIRYLIRPQRRTGRIFFCILRILLLLVSAGGYPQFELLATLTPPHYSYLTCKDGGGKQDRRLFWILGCMNALVAAPILRNKLSDPSYLLLMSTMTT